MKIQKKTQQELLLKAGPLKAIIIACMQFFIGGALILVFFTAIKADCKKEGAYATCQIKRVFFGKVLSDKTITKIKKGVLARATSKGRVMHRLEFETTSGTEPFTLAYSNLDYNKELYKKFQGWLTSSSTKPCKLDVTPSSPMLYLLFFLPFAGCILLLLMNSKSIHFDKHQQLMTYQKKGLVMRASEKVELGRIERAEVGSLSENQQRMKLYLVLKDDEPLVVYEFAGQKEMDAIAKEINLFLGVPTEEQTIEQP